MRNHTLKMSYSAPLLKLSCDHTKGIVDEEMLEYHTQLVRDADLFVYGRKTYQLMVPYWPDVAKNHSGQTEAGNKFAQAFDSIRKIIVFSKTLDKAEGKNTEIVRTDLKDEILKLKQEQGKSILTGGADIPSQLIQLGLVDEYHIVVHPVIAGEGRRLLEGISLAFAAVFLSKIGKGYVESGKSVLTTGCTFV